MVVVRSLREKTCLWGRCGLGWGCQWPEQDAAPRRARRVWWLREWKTPDPPFFCQHCADPGQRVSRPIGAALSLAPPQSSRSRDAPCRLQLSGTRAAVALHAIPAPQQLICVAWELRQQGTREVVGAQCPIRTAKRQPGLGAWENFHPISTTSTATLILPNSLYRNTAHCLGIPITSSAFETSRAGLLTLERPVTHMSISPITWSSSINLNVPAMATLLD